MDILSQFAGYAPLSPALRRFRFWFWLGFIIWGVLTISRAEQDRKTREAEEAAELKAFEEKLTQDREAYFERCDDEMTTIYRGMNTVLHIAGLDPIGDGDLS